MKCLSKMKRSFRRQLVKCNGNCAMPPRPASCLVIWQRPTSATACAVRSQTARAEYVRRAVVLSHQLGGTASAA